MNQTNSRIKVGLMFGSFNPPHRGHVATAARMREVHALDEVWILPLPISATKASVPQASFQQKMIMCQQVRMGDEESWLKISTACESFDSGYLGQFKSYLRVLRDFLRDHSDIEFSIIAGNDLGRNMRITQKFCSVINRLTAPVRKLCSYYGSQKLSKYFCDIASAHETLQSIPLLITDRSTLEVHFNEAAGATITVSSSKIRNAIATGETNIPGIPESLLNYIRSQELYGAQSFAALPPPPRNGLSK